MASHDDERPPEGRVEVRGGTLPPSFFKFRSMAQGKPRENARKIICEGELWFPMPSTFNDPFDCLPVLDPGTGKPLFRRLVEAGRQQMPHANRQNRRRQAKEIMQNPRMREQAQEAIPLAVNKTGVLSLSARNDQVLMWSHYADEHRGVCLEFSSDARPFRLAQPVCYTDKRPVLDLLDDKPETYVDKALLTKADFWDYEKEWRVIEYGRPGKHLYDPALLKAVILGAKSDDDGDVKKLVWEWLANRPEVKVIQAEIHPRQFRLLFRPLDRP